MCTRMGWYKIIWWPLFYWPSLGLAMHGLWIYIIYSILDNMGLLSEMSHKNCTLITPSTVSICWDLLLEMNCKINLWNHVFWSHFLHTIWNYWQSLVYNIFSFFCCHYCYYIALFFASFCFVFFYNSNKYWFGKYICF